ncbi:orotidine-5'-phosphate decarboxylase [Candidatus Saccharibacteria bacterium]|nr:orotidine-5'-phosphate decarboxylase [Candidatus Saccharibacteria bacterium]
MNFGDKLDRAIDKNNSLLCVGLDPAIDKMPAQFTNSDKPFFEFNKAIIDATADQVCCYKPNSAFYEAKGASGIEQLKETCDYIKQNYPEIPIILDAKRADIGNTNAGYVAFAFDYLGADAITLNPYMGKSALQPFLDRGDKGCVILCRTSNEGAEEFQSLEVGSENLSQKVAKNVASIWNENNNCLLVIGATNAHEVANLRQVVGSEITFLVPGIGAQGGDLEATLKAGLNTDGKGLIISASRSIIYASNNEDFAQAARSEAERTNAQINQYR